MEYARGQFAIFHAGLIHSVRNDWHKWKKKHEHQILPPPLNPLPPKNEDPLQVRRSALNKAVILAGAKRASRLSSPDELPPRTSYFQPMPKNPQLYLPSPPPSLPHLYPILPKPPRISDCPLSAPAPKPTVLSSTSVTNYLSTIG